jgi:radical SAM protein with 4Fe4S-binding SPASM domain
MRVIKAPTSIELFVTARCNLSCTHCFATAFSNSGGEPELTTAEWKRTLEQLAHAGVFRIGFTGGEVFVRKDALELLAFAKTLGIPKVTVGSNATLITAKIAAELKALQFQTVYVSVDGNEQANDTIRGKGAFKKIIRGISALLEQGIQCSVLFTVMRGNYWTLPEMVDSMVSLGVVSIAVHDVNGQGRCRYDQVSLNSEDWGQLEILANQIHERHPRLPLSIDLKPYSKFLTLPVSSGGKAACLKPCSAADSSCCITPSGYVIACPPLVDFPAGNVLREDFTKIWKESPVFRQIRELRQTPVNQIHECRDCRYTAFCTGGCRGKAYLASGRLLGPDPDCPYWSRDNKPVDSFTILESS